MKVEIKCGICKKELIKNTAFIVAVGEKTDKPVVMCFDCAKEVGNALAEMCENEMKAEPGE